MKKCKGIFPAMLESEPCDSSEIKNDFEFLVLNTNHKWTKQTRYIFVEGIWENVTDKLLKRLFPQLYA